VLNAETVYVNVCGKYKDMNVMASRTILVNPDDTQKKTYIIANEALDTIIKALEVGQPIKNAYTAGKKFIKSKDPNLAAKLHTQFGFGVRPDSPSLNTSSINFVDWKQHQRRCSPDQ
jgi:nucleosome binding factor SPN SPT16 subunit